MNIEHNHTISLPLKLQLHHLHKGLSITGIPQECSSAQKHQHSAEFKQNLSLLADIDRPHYSHSFVQNYLLIKINNLLTFGGQSLRTFAHNLGIFYNEYIQHPEKYQFKHSLNDDELMAQVLLHSHAYQFLSEEDIRVVLKSSGIVVASMSQTYFKVKKFMKKNQFAVTMTLSALYAKQKPFIHIVHQQKNHKGESDFAAIIFELMTLQQSVQKPVLKMVQDAYSLRCSPQVHGVVYDCFYALQEQLKKSINKPQLPQIEVNGNKIRNLCLRSQSQTLLIDTLVLSLNQIGHMSFLRSERVLNPYLSQNNISKSPFYELLKTRLQKISYYVVHNKALSAPTNADTVIMDSYKHDIYYDEGTPMIKADKMLQNLTEMIKLEFLVSVQVLREVYSKADRLFKADQMEKVYQRLKRAREEAGYGGIVRAVEQWFKEQ